METKRYCHWFSPPPGYGWLALVIAIGLSGYIFSIPIAAVLEGKEPSRVVLLPLYFSVLTFLAGWSIFLILLQLFGNRYAFAWFSLLWSLIGAYLVSDHFHYNLFLAHIDADAFELALIALQAGELKVRSEIVLVLVTGLLVWGGLLWSILLLIRRYISSKDRQRACMAHQLVLLIGLISIETLYFGLKHGWKEDASLAAIELYSPIPVPGEHGLGGYYGFMKEKVLVSDELESKQLDQLAASKDSMLERTLTAERKPDILMIHVESWRWDMMDSETTPRMRERLDRGWLKLDRHYSTGNNSGSGMSGLLNGLAGYYYPFIRHNMLAPIPLKLLENLGYSSTLHYSGDLRNYENLFDIYFAETVDYVPQSPKHKVELQERDIVDNYIASLGPSRENQPQFDYVLFNATHYDYHFTPEFEKFTPVTRLGFKITSNPTNNEHMREEQNGLFNRYRNSIHYVDHLVGRMIDALEAQGRLDNTIVIVTGDHGEEFWEKGRFGHSYGLTDEQIRVGAVAHFPGGLDVKYDYTSHEDWFPTIFDYMGLSLPSECFMSGKSLYGFDAERNFAVSSMGVVSTQRKYDYVVAGEGYKVFFQNKGELRPDRITLLDDAKAELGDTKVRDTIRALLKRATEHKNRLQFMNRTCNEVAAL